MSTIKPKFDQTRRTDYRSPTMKVAGPHITQYEYDPEVVKELFNSVYENNFNKTFKIFTDEKIPYTVVDDKKNTVLHIIIENDPVKYSESYKISMINKIPNFTELSLYPNNMGVTPLHLAAQMQYIRIIDMLCNKFSNINVVDATGMTPLHYAVIGYTYPCERRRRTQINAMPFFKVNNKLVNYSQQSVIGARELHFYNENKSIGSGEPLCIRANIETCNKLIAYGASLQIADNNGMTPLFYILRNNNVSLLAQFMDYASMSYKIPENIHNQNPFDYFKSLCLAYADSFTNTKSSFDKIKDFTEQHFENIYEKSNSYIDYYKNLYDSIPIKVFNMIDSQIKLCVGESIVKHLSYYATNSMDFSFVPFGFATSISKNVIDDVFHNKLKTFGKITMYNRKWDMFILDEKKNGIRDIEHDNPIVYVDDLTTRDDTTVLTVKKEYLFVEYFGETLKQFVLNPMASLSKQRLAELNYLCTTLENDLDTYNYIAHDADENYMLSYIVSIIAHILQTTVCYKMYIELIVAQAKEKIKQQPNAIDEYKKFISTYQLPAGVLLPLTPGNINPIIIQELNKEIDLHNLSGEQQDIDLQRDIIMDGTNGIKTKWIALPPGGNNDLFTAFATQFDVIQRLFEAPLMANGWIPAKKIEIESKDINNAIIKDYIEQWGKNMSIDITKAIFKNENVNNVITGYIKNVTYPAPAPAGTMVFDPVSSSSIITDHIQLINTIVTDIRSFINNYLEYISSGLQYARTLEFILKNFK
jgi:ankyrin repeat protein